MPVGHQNNFTAHSNGGSPGVGLRNVIRRVAANGDQLSVYITLARGRGDVSSVFADATVVRNGSSGSSRSKPCRSGAFAITCVKLRPLSNKAFCDDAGLTMPVMTVLDSLVARFRLSAIPATKTVAMMTAVAACRLAVPLTSDSESS